MNGERAKEIIESKTMIQVTLAGIPVYLQKLNDDGQTAQVFPLDEPDHEQNVPVTKLVEE